MNVAPVGICPVTALMPRRRLSRRVNFRSTLATGACADRRYSGAILKCPRLSALGCQRQATHRLAIRRDIRCLGGRDRPRLGAAPAVRIFYGVIAMAVGLLPTLIALSAVLVPVRIGVTVPESPLAT